MGLAGAGWTWLGRACGAACGGLRGANVSVRRAGAAAYRVARLPRQPSCFASVLLTLA